MPLSDSALRGIVAISLIGGCLGATDTPASTLAAVDVAGDAPPFLDVLSGRFIETPEAVTVEIQIAEFDEPTIVETLREYGSSAWIFLCWRQGNAEPPEWVRAAASVDKIVAPDTECAGVEMFVAETMPVIGQYISYHDAHDGCNAAWFCAWRLPHTIESGSPATLRIDIPRHLLYDASLGETLEDPHLESGIWPWGGDTPTERAGRSAYACVHAAGSSFCEGTPSIGSENEILDQSDPGPRHVLRFENSAGIGRSAGRTIIYDGRADLAGDPYDPGIDVLEVELEETGSEIAYLVQIASLEERPSHTMSLYLGIEDWIYSGGYEVVAGEITVWEPGRPSLSGTACDGAWECRAMTPTLTFESGTPGTIRFAFDCREMSARAGDRVNWAELWTSEQAYKEAEAPTGGVAAEAGAGSFVDPVFPGEPYWLQTGCA